MVSVDSRSLYTDGLETDITALCHKEHVTKDYTLILCSNLQLYQGFNIINVHSFQLEPSICDINCFIV